MATEIIVYNNPAQQAFWNTVMSGDINPIIAGAICGVAFFVIYAIYTEKLSRRLSRNQVDVMNWVAFILSIVIAYQVWSFLFSRTL